MSKIFLMKKGARIALLSSLDKFSDLFFKLLFCTLKKWKKLLEIIAKGQAKYRKWPDIQKCTYQNKKVPKEYGNEL